MKKPKIVAFGGSLRAGSYNQKLAAIAAEAARAAGAEVELVALRDFPMPVYDQDLEDGSGMPEGAAKFKTLLAGADGFLIASPEYNGGYSAALKNAIDWASRATADDEPPLSVFRGKTAAILASSPGGYGGVRGLAQLRELLGNMRVTVLEDQVTVPEVHTKIDDGGQIADAAVIAAVQALGGKLVETLAG
ncbi:MAG TPA: NAD(P)H-dependent oxidoreductase [Bacteroidia bacterium]|nr:NAD(P)H-dependent oxidoreductase [Bacteroidia bacterium]